jgi:hypothetical protein
MVSFNAQLGGAICCKPIVKDIAVPLSANSGHSGNVHGWPVEQVRRLSRLSFHKRFADEAKQALVWRHVRNFAPPLLLDAMSDASPQKKLEKKAKIDIAGRILWLPLTFHCIWKSKLLRDVLNYAMYDPSMRRALGSALGCENAVVRLSWKTNRRTMRILVR